MRVCRAEQLISPLAEARVRQLCLRGLSLEQTLVGTGLLSPQVFQRIQSSGGDRPLQQEGSQDTSCSSVGIWMRHLLRCTDVERATHLVIRPQEGRLLVNIDGRLLSTRHTIQDMRSTVLPSLRLWARRVSVWRAWHFSVDVVHGQIHGVRQVGEAVHHPFHSTELARTLSGDNGPSLTLCIDADRYTHACIMAGCSTDLTADRWFFLSNTPEEVEMALHAALAGSSGVIMLSRSLFDGLGPLWSLGHEAGLPMRRLQREVFASGEEAWESVPI